MPTNRKRIFFVVFVIAVAFGLYYFQKDKFDFQKNTQEVAEKSDKYVSFTMEVYDKISKIYWEKSTEESISNLFKLSLEKALSTTTPLLSKDRSGTERMLTYGFSLASTTESKKRLAINIATIALYNLQPAGRNQIFSEKQETQFRQTVSNINPQSDLYGDLGAKTGSSIEEVEKQYKEKILQLKNATSTEDKEKLKRADYAYGVLSNKDNKILYDEAKIEPTLKYKKIGSTFYVDLRQIAPTSLYEMVKAIDNASTTKNLDSLVIDFRGNIGGSLDFLPAFFGLFIGKDQFAFDLFSKGEYKPERTTELKYSGLDRFKEIAILTDNMTQSTAELTAATFKKFHMAKVVGLTTRGWGTVENTYPMETVIDPTEKYILLLVNSITVRDDGQPIEGKGVSPDVNTGEVGWQKKLPNYFDSQSLIDAIKTVVK